MGVSVLVFPWHDPETVIEPYLYALYPLLTDQFARVHVGVSLHLADRNPALFNWLQERPFFHVTLLDEALPIGQRFASLYAAAASTSEPEDILHLCFPDRLVFALASRHQAACLADLRQAATGSLPLLFTRSAAAWSTHPQNYAELEALVTTAGRWVTGTTLDLAWCHLVVPAHWLTAALCPIQRTDLSLMAELILSDVRHIHSQAVDWLEWEDPFFSRLPAHQLKAERETSPAETRKRLEYVRPMLRCLVDYAQQRGLGEPAAAVTALIASLP